jgi:predicted ATPase
MLTRLEADGFKNLLDFSMDFGPFTCIAGRNGVGKSNIFDAIRFLSLLADHSIMEAALQTRGHEDAVKPDDTHWEPEDLFWTDGQHRTDRLELAAEMIVDQKIHDDFGRPAEATSTFLRYEVQIGYDEPSSQGAFGRLTLLSERLGYITQGDASSRLRFDHAARDFRREIVKNKRRGSDFISTERADDGQTEILVHQDGGSRGQPQRAPAASAPRTIVATTNTSTTPTVLAARREMQQWRFLALEPSAMRRADRFYTDPHITSSGGHLPATLNRLATESSSRSPEGLYASITARLSDIVPVRNVRVNVDEVRQLLTLEIDERSGAHLPARSLSDGALRFLTLCVLSEDPTFEGLLCMEEPENGIHPARLSEMVSLLQDLAVDPHEPAGEDNPLRQVVVATHSPPFVQLQNPGDLLYAQQTRVKTPTGSYADTIRCRPIQGAWRASDGEGIGFGDLIPYLTTPSDAQIRMPELNGERATA